MKIECMWCNVVKGEKEGGEGVTSGVCDPCLEEHYPPDVVDFVYAERKRREAEAFKVAV